MKLTPGAGMHVCTNPFGQFLTADNTWTENIKHAAKFLPSERTRALQLSWNAGEKNATFREMTATECVPKADAFELGGDVWERHFAW